MCNCTDCKFCWRDDSVGERECTNENLTMEEIERYYCDMEDNCPHYVPVMTDEEIEAEEKYIEQMELEIRKSKLAERIMEQDVIAARDTTVSEVVNELEEHPLDVIEWLLELLEQ